MTFPQRSRVNDLARKYAGSSDIPPGEAFRRAFGRYLRANRESLLDVASAASSAHIALDEGPDAIDPLLLRAIQDTNPSLDDRLFSLDGEALQGAVNTAKGKYFEYLVVDRLNRGEQVGPLLLEPGQTATLAEKMNQPGWDLRIVDQNGYVVEFLQLKATDSVGYVQSALERYPDIRILSTSEAADGGWVLDSEISDAALRDQVGAGVESVDASLTDAFLDYFNPLLPLALMAVHEGYRVAVGARSVDAFRMALARRGQRMVVTQGIGAMVYALGGGLWSIPFAMTGGLVFDRMLNQTALRWVFQARRERLLALRLQQQERLVCEERR